MELLPGLSADEASEKVERVAVLVRGGALRGGHCVPVCQYWVVSDGHALHLVKGHAATAVARQVGHLRMPSRPSQM